MTAPRIAPVTDPPPEVVELYERSFPARGGKPLNIFATLAHHPALLKRWLVFGNHVLAKNTLSPRDRELLILRVGVLCRSRYEFGQHVVIARRSDISDEEIERVKLGPDASGWSEHERALLRAVDELHHDSVVSDTTWATLSGRYSTEQMLDVIFTIGQYHLVSFALNSCGVELDEGVPDAL